MIQPPERPRRWGGACPQHRPSCAGGIAASAIRVGKAYLINRGGREHPRSSSSTWMPRKCALDKPRGPALPGASASWTSAIPCWQGSTPANRPVTGQPDFQPVERVREGRPRQLPAGLWQQPPDSGRTRVRQSRTGLDPAGGKIQLRRGTVRVAARQPRRHPSARWS